MHRLTTASQPSPDSLEQAADWLLRLETEPDLEAFEAWLQADPEHAAAWAQVNRALAGLGALAPRTVRHWPPAPARPAAAAARRSPRRRWLSGLAAACVLGMTLSLLSPFHWYADYSTGTGEVRQFQLEDGSRLTLGPGSAVSVDFQSGARFVKLYAGEVFFQVAPDPGKPFRVDAGELEVRVIGTAFDVRLAEERLKVEVREGAVGVQGAILSRSSDYRLGAGDRLEVDHRSGAVTRSRGAPGNVASWTSGSQFFENASVAEVVEELQRYHRGWIVIADQELGQRRITGFYDVRNTRRALKALAAPLSAKLSEFSPLVLVLQKN